MKKCPYCAEEIQDEAIVCRYCGRDLQAPGQPIPAQDIQKSQTKKQTSVISIVGILILFLCGISFARFAAANSPRVTPSPIPKTPVEAANSVVISTFTPLPTNTAAPTRTPRPTATLTPIPEPLFFTSYGDTIFDFEKWEGPAILKIKYVGSSNFVVRNYPANSNDYYGLLVNTIGSYEGTLPLDFRDGEQTARFEVKASGTWELQIEPLENARVERVPGKISGQGDDVILIGGASPDLLKADASQAKSNFVVYAIAKRGIDLVINEIAPYAGTNIIDPSTIALVVKATGPWSLEITTR